MPPSEAIIVDAPASAGMRPSQLEIYDREIGVRLLHRDPVSGAEHYLVRYPAGLKTLQHRHTASQTIVVLEGRLAVGDEIIGPGSYCHFPSGVAMLHAPAGDDPCLFVSIFDGPVDAEPLDEGF
jgi:quercetin dioxygenase-like cupin family protein